jgi:pimeloyl-ACP methyl ester carboxylesterase
VTAPLLVIHGEADGVIPVDMGRAIYMAANAPKQILTFPGAGHSDHHIHGSTEEVFRWIDGMWGERAGAAPEKQMRP